MKELMDENDTLRVREKTFNKQDHFQVCSCSKVQYRLITYSTSISACLTILGMIKCVCVRGCVCMRVYLDGFVYVCYWVFEE